MSLQLVPQQNSGWKALQISLILILLVAIGLSSYRYYAKDGLASTVSTLEQQNQQLQQQNDQLEQQQQSLVSDLIHQQQTLALQQATTTELQAQLTTLQNEVISLNKELVFYRNITHGQTTSKLNVRELRIFADDANPEQYRYRLVLSQGKKITKALSGKITLSLSDQQQNKHTFGEHQLNLRHIQIVHGNLTLEPDKLPEKVTITIKQGKKTTLNTSLDWHEINHPI